MKAITRRHMLLVPLHRMVRYGARRCIEIMPSNHTHHDDLIMQANRHCFYSKRA
jgi:hypothetical protein